MVDSMFWSPHHRHSAFSIKRKDQNNAKGQDSVNRWWRVFNKACTDVRSPMIANKKLELVEDAELNGVKSADK